MPNMYDADGNNNNSALRIQERSSGNMRAAANEGPLTVEKLISMFRSRAANPPRSKTIHDTQTVTPKGRPTSMRVEIILPKGMRDYTGPSKPENVSVALEETLALLADRMGILSKLITSLSDQLAQQSQERADAHTDKPSVLQEAVSSNLQQFAIPKPPSDIVESLVETEKRAILNALRRTKWDVRAAARILGIGRTTVYRKLIEYKEQQLARSGGTE